MLKYTVLKFQGALSLLGFGSKGALDDNDSGNSIPTGSSDEESSDHKGTYLTTGVLISHGQQISEINITRHSMSNIGALIGSYNPKRKNIK